MAKAKPKPNVAGRLHGILVEAGQSAETENTLDVWTKVLRCQGDRSDVLRAYLKLCKLVDVVEHTVRSIDGANHDLLLKHYSNIRRAVAFERLHETWSVSKRLLLGDQVVLYSLESCAETVSQASPDREIPDSTLADLQKELDELLKEFLAVDDPVLREIGVRHLEAIRRAIVEYRVGGTEAMFATLESIVGAIVLRSAQISPRHEPLTQRLLKFLGKVGRALEVAWKTKELTGTILQLLGAPETSAN